MIRTAQNARQYRGAVDDLQTRAWNDCQRPEVIAAARAEWDALPEWKSAKQDAADWWAGLSPERRAALNAEWAA